MATAAVPQVARTTRMEAAAELVVARTVASKTSPRQAVKTSRKLESSRQRIMFLLAVSRKT